MMLSKIQGWLFMLKRTILFSFIVASSTALANKTIDLYQAPIKSLDQFKLLETPQNSNTSKLRSITPVPNTLQRINQTVSGNIAIVRYQQYFKGLPVVGAQITITKDNKQGVTSNTNSVVNGQLIDDIQLNTNPSLSSKAALDLAKSTYFNTKPQGTVSEEVSQLQIRTGENGDLGLTYLVSFKVLDSNNKPYWPFFLIDAQTGAITGQWDNIKPYLETGPGGNEKVHEYWYGKDGLPSLDVKQEGSLCTMESDKVKLVNLESLWDWYDKLVEPFQYPCNSNIEENINGAYSPSNDAYYFGHTIVDMYHDWYGMKALQHNNGEPMQLIMRVHFGKFYDNAFWDGQMMSFGDGEALYPLVSLDVAGHEVTHGFTEHHSNLEYHDQSGSLNESLSDMGGQTARAYLLETYPALYNRAYLTPNKITWGIGETIMRGNNKALRYMNAPSSDGYSADCVDSKLAKKNGASCKITYDQVVSFAKKHFSDPMDQQSFIVHTGSGVFNKAFYLLANDLGIKKAYNAMLLANVKYLTPSSNFQNAACAIVHAANDLNLDKKIFDSAFAKVGIATTKCPAKAEEV